MNSVDVNKTIPKDDLVGMTTKTTYEHLANVESAKDGTICESSHILGDKGKYYYSPINDSSDQKHANSFAIIFPVIKCNPDTNTHMDGNKTTS